MPGSFDTADLKNFLIIFFNARYLTPLWICAGVDLKLFLPLDGRVGVRV
jgi:hypothetical protein